MGYNIRKIRLGKKEADSTYYNADVNDAKMQEIAAALGMKLNIVESNTTWILYMGDDAFNTTGFRFRFSPPSLYMETVIQGATPSTSGYCYSYTMSLTRSANSGAANAFLHFVSCKDGVVFGIGNTSEGSNITDLLHIVLHAKDLKTNDDRVAYMSNVSSRYIVYSDVDETSHYASFWSQDSNIQDVVSLAQYVYPAGYLGIQSAYFVLGGPTVLSGSSGVSFEVNDQEYYIPAVSGSNLKIAIELPNSEQ